MKTYENQQLYQKLTNSNNLPPFPAVAARIMDLLQGTNCSFKEVHECLILDPALVALVLKVVNSPVFPIQREVTNINMALTFLGLTRLRNILYTYFFRTLYDRGANKLPLQTKLWNHALSVALYAQTLGIQLDYPDDSECFTAGLIHDIGRFVIGLQDLNLFKEILALAQEKSCDLLEAEDRLMGFNHQDVGYGIARHWNFPDVIKDAIFLHHEFVEYDRLPLLTRIVAISNLLAHAETEEGDSPSRKKAVFFLAKADVDEQTLAGMRFLYQEKMNSVRSLL